MGTKNNPAHFDCYANAEPEYFLDGFGWARRWTPPYIQTEEVIRLRGELADIRQCDKCDLCEDHFQ